MDKNYIDDANKDTPEKRLFIQANIQKIIHRICEINLNTSKKIHFHVGGFCQNIFFEFYYFGDNGKPSEMPFDNNLFYWECSEVINQWFLSINNTLDLLESEEV